MNREKIKATLKAMPAWLKIALAGVLLLLLAGSSVFLYFQSQVVQQEVEKELTAIARLKVDQISAWRKDQVIDAGLVARLVAQPASAYLANPSIENEAALRAQLQSLAAQHGYSEILLVDQAGEARWGLNGSEMSDREHLSALEVALEKGEPVFIDLYRSLEYHGIHVAVVAPLSNGAEAFGALVLINDAEQFLFPLLRSWPLPSESAETLLVRQEGDQVLFLNDLRHQPDAALEMRFPLSQADLPAVMAVQGVEGYVRGEDYRGVPVAAVLLPVPDSPWHIVAKIDAAEAFSDWYFRSAMTLAILLMMIALVGLGSVAIQQRLEKVRYRELHRSQARQGALLEAIYRNAPLVMMLVDGDRRIRQVNGFAAQFAGRSTEEMVGLRGGEALRCLHALDAPEGCGFGPYCQECNVLNTVLDTLENGVTHLHVEASLPFDNAGQEVQLTYLLSSTLLNFEEESLALVTMLEITDLVQARRESQRLLAQQRVLNSLALTLGKLLDLPQIYRTLREHVNELVDASFFVVFSYDERSKLIRAEYAESDRVYDVSDFPPLPLKEAGAGPQSWVVNTGEPLYTPDHRKAVEESQTRVTLEAGELIYEEGVLETETEETTRSAVYIPMKGRGKVIGVLQVQSKRLDAYTQEGVELLSGIANVAAVAVQNARLIASLEKTIAERTAELEEKVARLSKSERAMLYMVEDLNQVNAALQTQRRRLMLSNQELEAFAYSVSHDLRAPLRAINGFANFLAQDYRDKLDADGQRFIDVIQESASKMDRLISDLLNLSRISRIGLQRVMVDMSAVARAVYLDVADEAQQAAFEFKVQPLPPADCDPTLIKQVWKNLIENALKYSAKAPVKKITIGAREGEGETIYWVRDRGGGFDPKYQEKLFGVFQRLHSQDEYEGTGIGLAIVKRIIQRHGGRVWAEGDPGQGATFYFSLPNTST